MFRWYHQNLDTSEAESLLKEKGADGSYLVRPSKSSPGSFSLSIRRKDIVTHIKIKKNGNLYSLQAGGGGFSTLNDLIQYHSRNPICEKSGEVFELKQPFGPANKITERWFHGPIKGFAAEKLIREHGVNGSFLVRESHSRIGDYVLTVRIKEDNKNDQVAHVIIYHRDNKYDVGGGEKFDSIKDLVEHYQRKPMVESNGQVVNMRYPFNSTKTTALDLEVRIKELSKGCSENQPPTRKDGFDEEFEHLQHQECKLLYSKRSGQEDRNISKNRYKNILPFDHTRVILKRPPFDWTNINGGDFIHQNSNRSPLTPPALSNSDYINANHIKLVDSEEVHISEKTKPLPNSKFYIATQGPITQTINDFWWMVWQEKSECIIMATEEVENDRNKCVRYWPTIKERTLSAGPLTIEILSDSSTNKIDNDDGRPDYICREIEIYFSDLASPNHKFGKHRVKHYQYTAWPDQSIPENPASILNFIKLINRHGHRAGPIIVHCSAGIGRSGTLIVIDMLIDQLKKHGLNHEFDIQRIVQIVRAQRPGLVQTVAQYRFIYHAIQSYVKSCN